MQTTSPVTSPTDSSAMPNRTNPPDAQRFGLQEQEQSLTGSVRRHARPAVPHFILSSGNRRGCATDTQHPQLQQTLPRYFQRAQSRRSRRSPR